ncbi:riboflavin synthase [Catellatospora sp. NPDC049609]|uniref:riboflavin synthase n=1 Tax=Catellatospora sp. NPDC049609 TaxID=3155505 RepID=UPI003441CE6E
MFTGIVEELGEVVRLDWQGDGAVVTVRGPLVVTDARHGDSIAVNGVCLTVISTEGDTFRTEVMKETFDRSSLGSIAPGERVNLERAVTAATRLGGHIVQGHVDGVGTIASKRPGGGWEDVRILLPAGLSRYIVEKGSITVDGISLTVVAVDDESFTVSLIPTTLELTTLGHKQPGALVNLEVDVIAKYVEKLVAAQRGAN